MMIGPKMWEKIDFLVCFPGHGQALEILAHNMITLFITLLTFYK